VNRPRRSLNVRRPDSSIRAAAYMTTITTSHRSHPMGRDFTTKAAHNTPGMPPSVSPSAAPGL
jgi:hypothetical protein